MHFLSCGLHSGPGTFNAVKPCYDRYRRSHPPRRRKERKGADLMQIISLRDQETMLYAADELLKYLERVSPELLAMEDASIRLGLLEDLGLPADEVEDPVLEDLIDADIRNGSGYIAGSNPRSVLMGVYRYLRSAGCAWPRPGKDGEYIPRKDLRAHSFRFREKAAFPFRGQVIEGAVSLEMVLDTVEWLPKVGMNLFSLQSVVPYFVMTRWYEHTGSTVKADEHMSYERMLQELQPIMERKIKKCGLLLQCLGHGYLLEPWGVHCKRKGLYCELPDDLRPHLALVNGKREYIQGYPNWTQLCLSDDEARAKVIDWVVNYAKNKPYVDLMSMGLADASNNQCECEKCRSQRTADLYVRYLNELDAALTKEGLDTRIAMSVYIETYWPPIRERLNNPGRFVMQVASTSRSYCLPFSAKRYDGPLPPYQKNNYQMKRDFALTLSFVDEWRKIFDGKRVLTEYYLYTDHFFDPGYFQVSKLIHDDAAMLPAIGFHGMRSIQTQRCFSPNGLPNVSMAESLWNPQVDFDALAEDYFAGCYGADAPAAMDYLRNITKLFDPCELRPNDSIVSQDTIDDGKQLAERWLRRPSSIARLKSIAACVDSFRPTVEKNCLTDEPCRKKSWEILRFHGDYCKKLADLYVTMAERGAQDAEKKLEDMVDWLSRLEDEFAPQFDLFLFQRRMRQYLDKLKAI